MKRFFMGLVAFVTFQLPGALGQAQENKLFSYDLYLRTRYELADWFHKAGTPDAAYGFTNTKLQFGGAYNNQGLTLAAQGQYSQLIDLPRYANGIGAAYRSTNDDDRNPGALFLRQLYLSFKDSADDLFYNGSVGRFLYSNGTEAVSDEKPLEAIKAQRIANRVIGAFDFTVGRSFDGVRGVVGNKGVGSFAGSYLRPTQGGLEVDGMPEIDGIELLTAAVSPDLSIILPHSDAQLFYYYYEDSRNAIVKSDNRAAELRNADFDPVEVHNVGLHWIQLYPSEAINFHTLLWGILQHGDWGDLSHQAGAFAVEGGAQFLESAWKPSVRAGYNWGSGDDDPTDSKHQTFFQLLPTARQYANLPFFNAMNNQDAFVSGNVTPFERGTLAVGLHYLRLSQSEDLLYSGGGANKRQAQFGFAGLALDGSSELGWLPEATLSYEINQSLSGALYFGHLFKGSALDSEITNGGLSYGFFELVAKL